MFVSQLGQGGVQARSRRGHHDRNPVAEGEEPNRIHPVTDCSWPGARDGRKTKRVAEKSLDESLGKRAVVASRGATGFHFLKARLRNAPAAGNLVADFEALRNTVIGRLLGRGL